MPVRNFWIAADIDGRSTLLEGGPRSRDGGFSLTIYIRDNGGILRAVSVGGIARIDGTLAIDVSAAGDIAHSTTGHIEPGASGFTVTTQAGYAPRREPRSSSARTTRELLSEPATGQETADWCRYLDNAASSREECDCTACRLVIDAEFEREQAETTDNPLGIDPFGNPYATP